MKHLDKQSRRAVHDGAVFTFVLILIVLLACLLGAYPLAEIGDQLTKTFAVAACVMMLVAMRRQERAGASSLNGWDQSIALNGMAMLAHVLQRLWQ
jgi:hypothetical protein